MKTTRQYLSGCTWCDATGLVPNQVTRGSSVTAPLTVVCPVCNGAKTIIITETIETQDVKFEQTINEIE